MCVYGRGGAIAVEVAERLQLLFPLFLHHSSQSSFPNYLLEVMAESPSSPHLSGWLVNGRGMGGWNGVFLTPWHVAGHESLLSLPSLGLLCSPAPGQCSGELLSWVSVRACKKPKPLSAGCRFGFKILITQWHKVSVYFELLVIVTIVLSEPLPWRTPIALPRGIKHWASPQQV